MTPSTSSKIQTISNRRQAGEHKESDSQLGPRQLLALRHRLASSIASAAANRSRILFRGCQKSFQVRVGRMEQRIRVIFEIDFAIAQDQNIRGMVGGADVRRG